MLVMYEWLSGKGRDGVDLILGATKLPIMTLILFGQTYFSSNMFILKREVFGQVFGRK